MVAGVPGVAGAAGASEIGVVLGAAALGVRSLAEAVPSWEVRLGRLCGMMGRPKMGPGTSGLDVLTSEVLVVHRCTIWSYGASS